MEYIVRRCPICQAPTSEFKDGQERLFPCTCDWASEFWNRVQTVVYQDFLDKNMGNWSPKIFSPENSRNFKRFIKIQKVVAIQRVYDFAFRAVDAKGAPICAISKSVAANRNLFIRGPRGSGRGLITASIKMFATAKKISSTFLPGTFDVFKDDVSQTRQMGREGADARILVAHKYEDVALLALEGVKGEVSKNYKGEAIQRKHPAADAIDRTLAMRAGRPGSLLVSGPDFIQEIGDTAGDRLYEMLLSDKTSIVIMLTPNEADALLTSLRLRLDYYKQWLENLWSTDWEKGDKKLRDSKHLTEQAAVLQQALYFERAFPQIPSSIDKNGISHFTFDFAGDVNDRIGKLPTKLAQSFREFSAACDAKDFTYAEGVKDAQTSAVRECKALASRMSEREIEEVGAMLSMATAPKEEVARLIEEARILRDKMAGKSDDI
jgi:hypothetical protein